MGSISRHQIYLIKLAIEKVFLYFQATIFVLGSTRAWSMFQRRFEIEAGLSDEEGDDGCFIEGLTVVEDDLFMISEGVLAIEAVAEFAQREFGRKYGVICFFDLRWFVFGLSPYSAFEFGVHHVGWYFNYILY